MALRLPPPLRRVSVRICLLDQAVNLTPNNGKRFIAEVRILSLLNRPVTSTSKWLKLKMSRRETQFVSLQRAARL